jgi:hypothetical protein
MWVYFKLILYVFIFNKRGIHTHSPDCQGQTDTPSHAFYPKDK